MLALKPFFFTMPISCCSEIFFSSYSMDAFDVEKLTLADLIPSIFENALLRVAEQLAQCIPVIERFVFFIVFPLFINAEIYAPGFSLSASILDSLSIN